MKTFMNRILLLLMIISTGCESHLDFNFDPTEIVVEVLDDNGNPLDGALVKVFDDLIAYEEEKATGNSNLELLKGFTDETGQVVFGSSDEIDPEKDHYFYVSFRDRNRFVDLDNFNEHYQLSKAFTKKGGKSYVRIGLAQAKSAVSFFTRELSETSLPLQIYIDGELSGEISSIASTSPNAPSSSQSDGVSSFHLSQGQSNWMVVSQTGCVWLGKLTIGSIESHSPIEMNTCQAGNISFWIAEADKDLLPISISLSPNDALKQLTEASSITPTSCSSAQSLSVSRDAGEYSYYANSANGNCTWSGQFTLGSSECQLIKLERCDGTN